MRSSNSARNEYLVHAFAASRFVLLGLFATAPVCIAGSSSKDEKAALKVLEKGAEAAIDVMTSFIDVKTQVLFAEFDVVEFNLKQGDDAFEATRTFQALDEFQVEVAEALFECALDFAAAQKEATLAWLDAGHTLLDLPKGFSPCEKGPVRDFPRDVEKAVAKRYSKIEKRLSKIQGLFDEKADRHFAWQLEPPPVQVFGIADGTFWKINSWVNPSVDLIIVSSQEALSNDVRVQASGRAGIGTQYTLRLGGPNFSSSSSNQLVDANDRWHKEWNAIPERNLLISISGDPGSWGVTRAIGAR